MRTELHRRNPPLHHAPPTATTHLRPAPTHVRICELSALRPNKHPLRPPCKLLRRHSIHIQIPRLAFLTRLLIFNSSATSNEYLVKEYNNHIKSNILPRALSARALPVPWVFACCGCWLGGWDCVSERFAAGCLWLEGAWVDGRAGGWRQRWF